jgi:hypothetical protein
MLAMGSHVRPGFNPSTIVNNNSKREQQNFLRTPEQRTR